MYARVATFEGDGLNGLEAAIAANRRQIETALASPPEGLEDAQAVWMLVDRETGATVDLTLFESREGLSRGDETLDAMAPADAEGQRTSLGLYEVAFRIER